MTEIDQYRTTRKDHELYHLGLIPVSNTKYTALSCDRPTPFQYEHSRLGKLWSLGRCNKCLRCRQVYAASWAGRVRAEASGHNRAYFLTLTYDNKHLPSSMQRARHNLSRWIKDYRRFEHYQGRTGKSVRFFGVTERGDKFDRLHHHVILFSPWHQPSSITDVPAWSMGFARVEECNPARTHYATQYSTQKIRKQKYDFRFNMSQAPRLGEKMFTRFLETLKTTTGRMPTHFQLGKQKYPLDRSTRLWIREKLPNLINEPDLDAQALEMNEAALSKTLWQDEELERQSMCDFMGLTTYPTKLDDLIHGQQS